MADFMIRFFISNIFISGIIGILVIAKKIFKNSLSGRMQYHLWFLLLGLLAVPLMPFRLVGFSQIFSWVERLKNSPASNAETIIGTTVGANLTETASRINDFALSVSSDTPSVIGTVLFWIWITGILVMILSLLKSALHLRTLKKSALPVQNPQVKKLYHSCLKEMGIEKKIPVYSTAFLKSPIITGLCRPCIYLPIHLISDYQASDMRYMLLHELSHYRHKDIIVGYLMNLARLFYWFQPFVRYALKEMCNDREVACDTSVLEMLEESLYGDYANTLINFAEKISLTPFPFAAGLGENIKQLERRIINIASYEKPTLKKRIKGSAAFVLTAALLLALVPALSAYGADERRYQWKASPEAVSYIDLSAYFGEYEGSFVLYDLQHDFWSIYNMEHAVLRVSPNSTYKIYDALFGLEEGVITPDDSFLPWNKQLYPFEAWNADQTLQSAMSFSVNWYFQAMDERLGKAVVSDYLREIGYGNESMSGDLSTYWMGSSLKISPIEQVELLTKLYHNSFGFTPENIHAVKDSICLFTSENSALYGKTGTGNMEGKDVNGWFIGYVETDDNTWFFAANIAADEDANGSNAAKITMSILADRNLLKYGIDNPGCFGFHDLKSDYLNIESCRSAQTELSAHGL